MSNTIFISSNKPYPRLPGGRVSRFGRANVKRSTACGGWPVLLALLLACVSTAGAQQSGDSASIKSDDAALHRIFADQHESRSGVAVVRRARETQPLDSYRLLLQWVLPSESQQSFRVTADFVADNSPLAKPINIRLPNLLGVSRQQSVATAPAATLVSPAIELVQLAAEQSQLESLRERVSSKAAVTKKDEVAQLALLAAIDGAANDLSLLRDDMGRLLDVALSEPAMLDRCLEELVVALGVAAAFPELAPMLAEAQAIAREHVKTVMPRIALHRHLWSLPIDEGSLLGESRVNVPQEVVASANTQWIPTSRSTAFDRGHAFPEPQWTAASGSVRKRATHADDFLCFASPLQGDFSIEGHATGFGFREATFLVGGQFAGLASSHEQVIVGNIRGEQWRKKLSDKLSDTHSHGFIQLRTNVKDGTATVWFNGHQALEYKIVEYESPWVGIRNHFRVHGGVDGLTITGNPVIPDTIEMIGSEQLVDWYDYYQPPGTGGSELGGWQAVVDNQSNPRVAEIFSPFHASAPRQSFDERLLRYFRPVVEDGVIEYEFWYEPDSYAAYPAIGRTALLLTPQGVSSHQITDGRYSKVCHRPDQHKLIANSSEVPLNAGQWNRASLTFEGDVLSIAVNERPVYSGQIDLPPVDRMFGLFHYADQSALRVRNLRWTGEWPKEIPFGSQQVFADPVVQSLDLTGQQLRESAIVATNKESFDNGLAMITEGFLGGEYNATDEGVFLARPGDAGYRTVTLKPAIALEGDFDFVTRFDGFVGNASSGNIACVRSSVVTESELRDTALVQLMTAREGQHQVQCMKKVIVDGSESRNYFGGQPSEASAGRLRLSRRGEKLYYLVADNDSTAFRLLGEQDFTDEPVPLGGLQVTVQIQGKGGHVACWFRDIEVRADKVTVAAKESGEEILSRLNARREQISVQFSHDFTTTAPADDVFYRWLDHSPWQPKDGGLRLTAAGNKEWVSAGLNILKTFSGDFDVRIEFEPTNLIKPESDRQTQVFLQLELQNSDETQISAVLTHSATKNYLLQAQSRNRSRNLRGYSYDTFATHPVGTSNVDYLRIVREGNIAYLIAGLDDGESEFFIGQREIGPAPLAIGGVKSLLHPGHSDGDSQVLLKSFEVRATGSSAVRRAVPQPTQSPDSPAPNSAPPSIFESIRRLFN